MYRSEGRRNVNDIYYYISPENLGNSSVFRNELVIHGYASSMYSQSEDHFYIGVTNKDDIGTRWVAVSNYEVDNIITALLYAKHLSEHPEARKDFTK